MKSLRLEERERGQHSSSRLQHRGVQSLAAATNLLCGEVGSVCSIQSATRACVCVHARMHVCMETCYRRHFAPDHTRVLSTMSSRKENTRFFIQKTLNPSCEPRGLQAHAEPSTTSSSLLHLLLIKINLKKKELVGALS